MYRSFEDGSNHYFSAEKWVQMGIHIGEGLKDTISKVYEDIGFKEKEKGKKKNNPKIITPIVKSRNQAESGDFNNKQNVEQDGKSFKRINSSSNLPRSISNRSLHGKKEVENSISTKNMKLPITSLSF